MLNVTEASHYNTLLDYLAARPGSLSDGEPVPEGRARAAAAALAAKANDRLGAGWTAAAVHAAWALVRPGGPAAAPVEPDWSADGRDGWEIDAHLLVMFDPTSQHGPAVSIEDRPYGIAEVQRLRDVLDTVLRRAEAPDA